jgi:Ca-activated chloride channel family protein
MKINEVTDKQLEEGPIDFAKQVGAGIKGIGQGAAGGKGVLGKVAGLATGAKLGWQAQGRENKQLDLIKKVTGNASKDWDEMSQNIKSSTGKPPTADDAVAWFTKFSGTSPSIAPAGANPTQINQWLQKEISGYMIKKGSAPQGTGTATAQPQAGQAQPQGQTDGGGTQQPGQAQPQPGQTDGGGTQQPQPGQAQPVEPVPLPIPLEKLTKEERAELRRQLQASLKMAA